MTNRIDHIEYADAAGERRGVFDFPEARQLAERSARETLGRLRETRTLPPARRSDLEARMLRALAMPDSKKRARLLDELDGEARRSISTIR